MEMTCRAPRAGICGGGSTLSEYELYFNYARSLYPESVVVRPLLWANGPAPGLLFWPDREDELVSDGFKRSWKGHRQNEGERAPAAYCLLSSFYSHRPISLLAVVQALEQQIQADAAQGYDYVGYHNYAKRRYYEVVGGTCCATTESTLTLTLITFRSSTAVDLETVCRGQPAPRNTTCSWRGLEPVGGRAPDDWFRGCACYMAQHAAGP